MKRLFLAAALALGLAGCGTPAEPPVTPPAIQPGPSTGIGRLTTADDKALATAELAYNTAATAYIEAVDAALLKGAPKDAAKRHLMNAYTALVLARSAYNAADTNSFRAQVAEAQRAAETARQLIPATPPR